MEKVRASIVWPGPDIDVLRFFVEPEPPHWEADPIEDEFAVFVVLDDDGQETGEIAGFEIIGFLGFDRWDELPMTPTLWQVADSEPLPLVDLLKREQALLQKHHLIAPRR